MRPKHTRQRSRNSRFQTRTTRSCSAKKVDLLKQRPRRCAASRRGVGKEDPAIWNVIRGSGSTLETPPPADFRDQRTIVADRHRSRKRFQLSAVNAFIFTRQ